jgi:hypothetical protein
LDIVLLPKKENALIIQSIFFTCSPCGYGLVTGDISGDTAGLAGTVGISGDTVGLTVMVGMTVAAGFVVVTGVVTVGCTLSFLFVHPANTDATITSMSTTMINFFIHTFLLCFIFCISD